MASKSSSKKVPGRRIRQGRAIAELERRNPNAYTKTKNCLDKIPDEELKRKDRIETFRKQVAEARQLAHIDILREEALTGIDHATIEAIECDCNRKKINRDYLLRFSLVFQNSPYFLSAEMIMTGFMMKTQE